MKHRSLTSIVFLAACSILAFAPVADAKKGGTLVKGVVSDGSKQPIANATVYLIPATDVEKLAKAPSIEIKRDTPNDEPMEDTLAANRDKYRKGTTDKKGNFSIPKVADGKYFVYTEPSDKEHLPGDNYPTNQ